MSASAAPPSGRVLGRGVVARDSPIFPAPRERPAHAVEQAEACARALTGECDEARGDNQVGIDFHRLRLAKGSAFIALRQCLEIAAHTAPLQVEIGHRAKEQRVPGVERGKRIGIGPREGLCPAALHLRDDVVHCGEPAAVTASTSIRKSSAKSRETSTKVTAGAAGGVTLAKNLSRAWR